MLTLTEVPTTTQYHLFYEEKTQGAVSRYKDRHPGTTNKRLIHNAIEYYVCWVLTDLGYALPWNWKLTGDKPKEIQLNKEKKGDNDYYSTVLIERSHDIPVKQVAVHTGLTPRKVVMMAVRAYLADQGFLNVEN